MFVRSIQICLLTVLLSGCAGMSAVSAVTSLASASKSGMSASLQVGDKEVATKVIAKEEKIQSTSSVKSVKAKESKIDQSTKKEDKKTEIGQVKGDVKVVQGPSSLTLLALASGWPLFVSFLIYLSYRKSKNA